MAERMTTKFVNELMTIFISRFQNGVMAIYSGMQPMSANDEETGELLCVITKDGEPFAPGSTENGLVFDSTPTDGVVNKASSDIWSGTVLRDGVAGWFRFYDNSYTTGANANAMRFDGRIGTGTDAELQITNPQLIKDGLVTITTFPVTLPMAGV